jgi:hypothetical protein
MPQESEMKDAKCDESKTALYPSSSIGNIAPDYVIRAVAKEEGKQEIELAGENRIDYEGS